VQHGQKAFYFCQKLIMILALLRSGAPEREYCCPFH